MDDMINLSLWEIGNFVGADRCYLFEYDFVNKVCHNTHEWCAEGVEPQIENLQNVPFSAVPDWVGMHADGGLIDIPDVLSLASESGIRQVLEPQGIKSLLAVPLMDGRSCLGFAGFDSVKRTHIYSPAEQRLLLLFAEMLVNVRKRRDQELRLRESERALRESELKYESLACSMPVVIYQLFMDTENRLSFSYVSPKIEEMLGLKVTEIMGNYGLFYDLIHSEYKSPFDEAMQDSISSLQSFCLTLKMDCAGQEKWLELHSTPGMVSDNGITWNGIFIDVTSQKKTEQSLAQSQKMESIGLLAGGIAHDFNNMLSIIIGCADLLRSECDSDRPDAGERRREFLEEIIKASKHSVNITRQLLVFSRKEEISPRPIEINYTIGCMSKILKRLIRENIVLEWQPADTDCWVFMDPSQLDQILANLCINARDAIDAMNKNGRIVVKTSDVVLEQNDCELAYPELSPGEYVIISVSDNGCGMDQKVQKKIFEPFFTTKDSGKGTGLGLATVYGIVRQNKGCINVQSAPGRGTDFEIMLPRYICVDDECVIEKDYSEKKLQDEVVLLVEDDPGVLVLLTCMLEQSGCRVFATLHVQEALKIAKECGTEISLLLTDVIMPGLNGRELAREICAFFPQIKVLFMSGHLAETISNCGIRQNDFNFIQKPFQKDELVSKIREVLSSPQGFCLENSL
jgi:PAS domain S-box-containing protein